MTSGSVLSRRTCIGPKKSPWAISASIEVMVSLPGASGNSAFLNSSATLYERPATLCGSPNASRPCGLVEGISSDQKPSVCGSEVCPNRFGTSAT